MANADPTRNIKFAIRSILPDRPVANGNRRLIRFLGLVLVALLVVILALNVLNSIGSPKSIGLAVCLGWMSLLCVGTPITLFFSIKDQRAYQQAVAEWEANARRLAIEKLGLDLSAGRMPNGLVLSDIYGLDHAAGDWRQSRDALEALAWVRGDLGRIRDDLRARLDESMANVLAEAGAGHPLGPSPFLIERARALFAEVGVEANMLSQTQAPTLTLHTDDSLELLRASLTSLRDVREAGADFIEQLVERIEVEGS